MYFYFILHSAITQQHQRQAGDGFENNFLELNIECDKYLYIWIEWWNLVTSDSIVLCILVHSQLTARIQRWKKVNATHSPLLQHE